MTKNEIRELIQECLNEIVGAVEPTPQPATETSGTKIREFLDNKFQKYPKIAQLNWGAWLFLTPNGRKYGIARYGLDRYKEAEGLYMDVIEARNSTLGSAIFVKDFGIRDAVLEKLERPTAPAKFAFIQPNYKNLLSPDKLEMWNLTRDILGHPKGSTISRWTLENAGFKVPNPPGHHSFEIKPGTVKSAAVPA